MTNRWQRSLDEFTQKHADDAGDVDGHDILFIVSPASGGGNAMRLYPTCFEELKATGRAVEVYVAKGSDDVIGLSKSKDLTPYKTIVILSGDSTVYEFLQAPLSENNGKWPYKAALLVLPGGSSNVMVLEDFGAKASVQQIIRQTLSLWNNDASIKKASVIQVSSETAEQPRYSLHVAFTGFITNMIDYGDRRRQDVYPILGKVGWVLSMVAYIPFMDNQQDDPTLLNVFNSDIEPNSNMGFGNSRFGDSMTVLYIPKSKNPGKKEVFAGAMRRLMSGDLAKDWKEGTLPDYITVEKTNKYVYQAPKPGSHHKLYSDGTSLLPFECTDDTICFESIPEALPFWSVPDKEVLEPKPEHWNIETVSVLSNLHSVREAYIQLASPAKHPQCNILGQEGTIRLAEGAQEPLKKGDSYEDASGIRATVLESTLSETDQECTFHVSLSSTYGWVQREVRVSIANRKNDGVVLGRVQEKCTAWSSWMGSKDADLRLAHRNLLDNLNDVTKA